MRKEKTESWGWRSLNTYTKTLGKVRRTAHRSLSPRSCHCMRESSSPKWDSWALLCTCGRNKTVSAAWPTSVCVCVYACMCMCVHIYSMHTCVYMEFCVALKRMKVGFLRTTTKEVYIILWIEKTKFQNSRDDMVLYQGEKCEREREGGKENLSQAWHLVSHLHFAQNSAQGHCRGKAFPDHSSTLKPSSCFSFLPNTCHMMFYRICHLLYYLSHTRT